MLTETKRPVFVLGTNTETWLVSVSKFEDCLLFLLLNTIITKITLSPMASVWHTTVNFSEEYQLYNTNQQISAKLYKHNTNVWI